MGNNKNSVEGNIFSFKLSAEDYFIAKAIQARGLHTVICSQPALQNAGDTSAHSFKTDYQDQATHDAIAKTYAYLTPTCGRTPYSPSHLTKNSRITCPRTIAPLLFNMSAEAAINGTIHYAYGVWAQATTVDVLQSSFELGAFAVWLWPRISPYLKQWWENRKIKKIEKKERKLEKKLRCR